jgi:hypothetical protein
VTSRPLRAATVLALALAAAPARAYVRTTDASTGQSLAWPVPAVPWHLNRDWPHTAPSCEVTPAGADPALDAVRASFAEWEQSCTDLRLLYAGPSAEIRVGAGGAAGNVVVFRRGWCSQHPSVVDPVTHAVKDPCLTSPDGDCGGIYDCFDDGPLCIGATSCLHWGIVALTSVLYDPTTGRIMSADVEVNGWDGTAGGLGGGLPPHGWYFTCHPGPQPAATCGSYGQDACVYVDLQNTVTHEVGHFLGLAHPCTTDAAAATAAVPLCSTAVPAGQVPYLQRTMSPSTTPGETTKRRLSDDELAAMCDIYPAPSGGCGCGAGAGAGTLSLALLAGAAVALRPRRRRLTRR